MAVFERALGDDWVARVSTVNADTLRLDVWGPTEGKPPLRVAVQIDRRGLTPAARTATCATAVADIRIALATDAVRHHVVLTPEPSAFADRIALLIRDVHREP